MIAPNPSPPTLKVLLGMVAYALQLLGLLLMPLAVAAGFWIQSNQGLWWELWFALAGIVIFFTGRTLLRWIGDEAVDSGEFDRMKEPSIAKVSPREESEEGDVKP